MWYCFLQSGVHATITGVLLAFVIPFNKSGGENVSYRLQHFLHKPVAFIIVPVFALVNTAIVIPPNFLTSLTTPNSLGIMLGLLVGKLTGIFLFPYILIKTGIAGLQEGMSLKSLAGIGCLGSIGFTMSMFISNLAFDDAGVVSTSKLSILIASGIGAIIGLLIFLSGSAPGNAYQKNTSLS